MLLSASRTCCVSCFLLLHLTSAVQASQPASEASGYYIDTQLFRGGTLRGVRFVSSSSPGESDATVVGSDDGKAWWGSTLSQLEGAFDGEHRITFADGTEWVRDPKVLRRKSNHVGDYTLPAWSHHIGGYYLDPEVFEHVTLRGSRVIAEEGTSGVLTMIGSDDGTSFWSVRGSYHDDHPEQLGKTDRGHIWFDMTPIGGPARVEGKHVGRAIEWADGTKWARSGGPVVCHYHKSYKASATKGRA